MRRGHYAIEQIFTPDGIYGRWGWRGIVSYLIGFAAMTPFFSTGLYEGFVAKDLGGADISIFIGLPVAAILYYVLTRSLDTAHERAVAAQTDVNLEQLAAAHSRHLDGMTTDPFAADAFASAASVRAGEVSAAELVEASLDAIARDNPAINAFTVVLADEARAQARDADAAVSRGEQAPLLGVPITIKDHIWMRGAPATNGSLAYRDFVPDVDCEAVARLRAAGAIIVGKTNNPEFCYRGTTDNRVFGVTRNPWNLSRTPGGSSGGAGASVAAGMTPIALGTDGGGSVRIPASFCGVVGHKPTFGLVPKEPGFKGWKTLSVDGPITRSVRDAALALSVLAGPAAADDMTYPVPSAGLCRGRHRGARHRLASRGLQRRHGIRSGRPRCANRVRPRHRHALESRVQPHRGAIRRRTTRSRCGTSSPSARVTHRRGRCSRNGSRR